MENRKPFNLRYTLIIYNFIQVIFSAWLFYEVSAIKFNVFFFFFNFIKTKLIQIFQISLETIEFDLR